ncbi:MAG TPA: CPBP family intramembrane glutamic endopeptidase [Terracidiphilus sp.]|nr:CPBP family intramembrane glutamic endopeptidase [Terracidiphilus sp.]
MSRDFAELLENLPAETLPVEARPPRKLDEKTLRWFELGLVLLIAFGSKILQSISILVTGSTGSDGGPGYGWIYSAIEEAGCLLLLGYILYRRKMRFRDLGLRWSGRDVFRGLLVTAVAGFAYLASNYLLQLLHHAAVHVSTGGATARQVFGHVPMMAIPLIILNPFFEDLIVRAYLMTEIKELTGSWALAAAASMAVQISYHLYYGWVGALALGGQFLVFSIYYARTKRATPIIVAHGIFDVWGMAQLM